MLLCVFLLFPFLFDPFGGGGIMSPSLLTIGFVRESFANETFLVRNLLCNRTFFIAWLNELVVHTNSHPGFFSSNLMRVVLVDSFG